VAKRDRRDQEIRVWFLRQEKRRASDGKDESEGIR
jgi:hypothetical protein